MRDYFITCIASLENLLIIESYFLKSRTIQTALKDVDKYINKL